MLMYIMKVIISTFVTIIATIINFNHFSFCFHSVLLKYRKQNKKVVFIALLFLLLELIKLILQM